MGRLLYDLHFVSEKTLNKFRRDAEKMGKASFALAWVMDESTDERARGITVDTATRNFETDTTRFTILDAPGHQDFIPNMIAGASQADFAVLVIDAGTNSFESGLRGQTREHAILVRSIGVQKLIVAVNKMDMVSWSQERFNEIVSELTPFLTASNFPRSSVIFVPCAGLTGENLLERPKESEAQWYTGPTLVQALDEMEGSKRDMRKPFRLTVSEVVRSTLVSAVSGRIEAGSVQVGDSLTIMPANQTALVKSIEEHDSSRDWAVAGQVVTLRLVQIDPQYVRAGDILCASDTPVPNVSKFTAKVLTFEHIMPMFVQVHRGRQSMSGKVSALIATLDKTTGKVVRKKPRVVQPGDAARVEIEIQGEMPLESGWKVILRTEGRSVAAGVVE
jgi:elongation factor 1 alpha-like protein